MSSKARIFAVLLTGIALIMGKSTAADAPSEYTVKAAFIYNFVRYVQWPESSFSGAEKNFNFCIVGANPFGSAMSLFKRSPGGNASITVKEGVSAGEVQGCHILFIGQSQAGNVNELLQAAQNLPVLTVSEVKNFTKSGGMVEFATVEKNIGVFSKDKVNLIINLKVAGKNNLKFDPQLLEIAAQVIR